MSAGVCVNCEYIENYPQSIKDGKLPRDTNLQSCKCVCYNAERCVIHLSPKNTAQCAICRNCWTLRVRRNNVRARKVKNTGAYRKCALKAPNSKYIFSASFSLSLCLLRNQPNWATFTSSTNVPRYIFITMTPTQAN